MLNLCDKDKGKIILLIKEGNPLPKNGKHTPKSSLGIESSRLDRGDKNRRYKIVVKVADILGQDTTQVVEIKFK